jgi:DNA/RNA endonuclease G (NUC1)
MRNLLLAALLLPLLCFGQAGTNKVDTVIYQQNYTCYFSKKHQNPIVLTYKLYKGGGDCSRAKFRFKNDLNIKCLTDADYLKSGYDKGHLANAEDFANNCVFDELTFRYYNCVPQTKELNRGVWKQQETIIRTWSQTDSLLVLCFNDFTQFATKSNSNLHAPQYCIKAVKSLTTKKWLMIMLFTNTPTPTTTQLTEADLLKRFQLDLSKY